LPLVYGDQVVIVVAEAAGGTGRGAEALLRFIETTRLHP
jgi:hypothetical protein